MSNSAVAMVLAAVFGVAVAGRADRFEVAAWIDHFDFARTFDTESAEGLAQILDYAKDTGVTTIYWRINAGSTMRFASRVEATHHPRLIDKRRTFDNRDVHGWVHYGGEPDILRTALQLCRERGMKPYIHWPFEENHWALWTIGDFNLEHPQYWVQDAEGRRWVGRCTLAAPEVRRHKLDFLQEALDRGAEGVFVDFFRQGGNGPQYGYGPELAALYEQRFGEPLTAESPEERRVQLRADLVTQFFRELRRLTSQSGREIELIAGIPGITAESDYPLRSKIVDWRALLDEGLIDTLVVNYTPLDAQRPFESYAGNIRGVQEIVANRARVLWPVRAYNYGNHGMPDMQRLSGLAQPEVAGRLIESAWDSGADGVHMECLDWGNYSDETRAKLRELCGGKCRDSKRAAPPQPAEVTAEELPPPLATTAAGPGEAEELTDGPGNDTEAAWSPDGTRIVFQSDRAGSLDLWLLDLRTREVTPLTEGPADDCFPAWSPDGQSIAFASNRNGPGFHLYRISATGGEVTQFTTGQVRDYAPAFSPDDAALHFASTREGQGSGITLCSMAARGGEIRVTIPAASSGTGPCEPSVSLDGKWLAFAYCEGFRGNWGVWLTRRDAPAPLYRLTDDRRPWYAPAWSPRGPLIAATSTAPGESWDIWVHQAFGEEHIRVTDCPANCRSPAWSPDGTRLAFECNATGRYKLYVSDAPTLPAPGPEAGALASMEASRFGYIDSDNDPAKTSLRLSSGSFGIALDCRRRSVGLDLRRPLPIAGVELLNENGTVPSRLEQEHLSVWVSDDNRTYREVKPTSYAKERRGAAEAITLAGLNATARYVKVHQTWDGKDDWTFSVPDCNRLMKVRLADAW